MRLDEREEDALGFQFGIGQPSFRRMIRCGRTRTIPMRGVVNDPMVRLAVPIPQLKDILQLTHVEYHHRPPDGRNLTATACLR